MKKRTRIFDLCIFVLSLTTLLIAFFYNMEKPSLLIGAGLIVLLGIAHTRMDQIAGLSTDNPKVNTMRRMNTMTMIMLALLYVIPLINHDGMDTIPYSFIFLITIMMFSGNIATKLPLNTYMGLRLPWTTKDEKTWKMANRVLGYITFPIVLLMSILYFGMGQSDMVLMLGILLWITIPAIYSYIKQPNRKERNS